MRSNTTPEPMLDAAAIAAQAAPWSVQCHDTVSSTNDLARDAHDGAEALAIFAEGQTAGRGQRGNQWLTPSGQDLMFSLRLRPAVPLELWPRFTTLAALAVCQGIEDTLPLLPKIKWPNDLYLGPRKVCGLLAETFTSSAGMFLVIGIGVNVNSLSFDPALEGKATSLRCELTSQPLLDREEIAAAILRALHRTFHRCEHDFTAVIDEVRSRSQLIGQSIRARMEERVVHGRVLDLNYEGHLVIELPDGHQRTLSSAAEVRLA